MPSVLVVEDDDGIQLLIKTFLERAGYEVALVGSGADALAHVSAAAATDVVVSDLGLPDVGGFDLLAQLRAATARPGLPAVFLTGSHSDDDVARGRALGAGYLTKPFVAPALIDAVAQALDAATAEGRG